MNFRFILKLNWLLGIISKVQIIKMKLLIFIFIVWINSKNLQCFYGHVIFSIFQEHSAQKNHQFFWVVVPEISFSKVSTWSLHNMNLQVSIRAVFAELFNLKHVQQFKNFEFFSQPQSSNISDNKYRNLLIFCKLW